MFRESQSGQDVPLRHNITTPEGSRTIEEQVVFVDAKKFAEDRLAQLTGLLEKLAQKKISFKEKIEKDIIKLQGQIEQIQAGNKEATLDFLEDLDFEMNKRYETSHTDEPEDRQKIRETIDNLHSTITALGGNIIEQRPN